MAASNSDVYDVATTLHARALTQMAELVASAFKHLPYAADPLPVLEALSPLMVGVMAAPNGMAALSVVLRYVLQVSEVEVDQLKSLVGRRLGKPRLPAQRRLGYETWAHSPMRTRTAPSL